MMKNIIKKINLSLIKKIIFIIIITVAIVGCQKAKENQIEGTWEVVNIADVDSKNIEEWYFMDNDIYFLEQTFPIFYLDTLVKGNYYIHPKLTKTEISIVITEYSGHNNFKVSPYDGTWEITKFSKDKLRIAIEIENSDGTGRGLIVKEFVKRD
jgi:nitrous oxide reductase accessory protein NosL